MRRSSFCLLFASGCALLLCTQLAVAAEALPSPPKPGTFDFTVRSGGLERTAHVHVPKGYSPSEKPPLVLMLHGAGGNGQQALEHDHWITMSDKAGFIVVAPDGLPALPRQPPNFVSNPPVWNSGQLRPRGPRAAIDDVAFIRQLLDDLEKAIPYNPRQVYCTGHSNGGGMTFRLGAELSDRFTAIATVAGMIAVEDPKPKKPLPTLYILGTRDPLMPMNGGEVTLPWGGTRQNPPVADQLAKWARAIGCEAEPKEVSDQKGIKRLRYPTASGGPELTVIYLEGHGHQWPGGKRSLPEGKIGPITSELDATEEIWKFFAEHAGQGQGR
jgi:polyhydroxybutyrate depolymerase